MIKWGALGLAIAAIRARRKRMVGAHGLGADVDTAGAPDLSSAAPSVGISEVDPQPITHVAGEGIVPGEVEAAHGTISEQRERLPNKL